MPRSRGETLALLTGHSHSRVPVFNSLPIRIFDYAQFVAPHAQVIRENAEALARENGLTLEYIRKQNFRKAARLAALRKKRGRPAGWVPICSALEPCASSKPWHDQNTHKIYLLPEAAKSLQYYFDFMDAPLGLC